MTTTLESPATTHTATTHTAESIAHACGGARRAGPGWLCYCPAHNDSEGKHPSLTVNPGKKRPVVINCKAGCSQEQVIAALTQMGVWSESQLTDSTPHALRASSRSQDDWEPVCPVPDNAPDPLWEHPKHGAPNFRYEYRDAERKLMFIVDRFDPPGERKVFCPQTYARRIAEYKWLRQLLIDPHPLYGLDALAERPAAPVLIVEGEKCRDAAAALLPHYVVVSWPCGAGGIGKTDWAPLAGRAEILIWPDNDEPGLKAAREIARALKLQHKTKCRILSPPTAAPKKWDAADATVIEAESMVAQPEESDSILELVKPLGFAADQFYYYSASRRTITALRANEHKELQLLSLHPDITPWSLDFPSKRASVDWKAAATALMAGATHSGWFSRSSALGRGAHYNAATSTLTIHAGNQVTHLAPPTTGDACEIRIESPGPATDGNIYESGPKLPVIPIDSPMSDSEATDIYNLITSQISWERPFDALLLAGIIVTAPFSGALSWRPHAWLTARRGYGKTFLLSNLVTPLMGGYSITAGGSSTESSIRQSLQRDSLPIIFDESEAEDPQAQARIKNVIQLIRQSSSGARIVRGTPGGTPLEFLVRSTFLLSSIAVPALREADESRICVLSLGAPREGAAWATLRQQLSRITPATGQRLMARTARLWPVFCHNQRILSDTIGAKLHSQRHGDQYGTLLAGMLILARPAKLTQQQADAYVQACQITTHIDETLSNVSDEMTCLYALLQSHIRVDGNQDRTVGELVSECHTLAFAPAADTALRRIGLRVSDGRLYIATGSRDISKLLTDTPYAERWMRVLARVPGCTRSHMMRFTSAHNGRAMSIPCDLFASRAGECADNAGSDRDEDQMPA